MKRIFLIWSGLLLMMVSCNSGGKGTVGTSSEDSTATETVSADDGKHTADYITRRLGEIYQQRENAKCCSERYMKLYNEASQLSKRSGMTFLSGDHWVQGNDVDEKWSYRILDVTDITPTTATARVLINNFTEREVTLRLVFERDDWYVDNFINEMEGNWDGSGAEPEVFDEVKDIQEYINSVKADVEIAEKLVGDWGWTGDTGPELLLGFTLNEDGQLQNSECTIYRIYSFHHPLCGVYDGKLKLAQRPDQNKIDLSLQLNEKGDELSGHIELKLADGYHYDGHITLRKNYFRYEDN